MNRFARNALITAAAVVLLVAAKPVFSNATFVNRKPIAEHAIYSVQSPASRLSFAKRSSQSPKQTGYNEADLKIAARELLAVFEKDEAEFWKVSYFGLMIGRNSGHKNFYEKWGEIENEHGNVFVMKVLAMTHEERRQIEKRYANKCWEERKAGARRRNIGIAVVVVVLLAGVIKWASNQPSYPGDECGG